MRTRNLFHGIAILVLAVFVLAPVPVALSDEGAIINVNTTVDDVVDNGNCTLREAIIAANIDQPVDTCPPGSGADTILLPEGNYPLQVTGINENDSLRGDLDIRAPVTIEGLGAGASIQGFGEDFPPSDRDRILDVWFTAGSVQLVRITLKGSFSGMRGVGLTNSADLTLKDCAVTDNRFDENYGFPGGGWAGGIYNYNDLHLLRSRVSSNYGGIGGGGIYNEGRVWVTESAINENTAGLGGAVINIGSMWIEASAINQNTAANTGAIHNAGDLVMTNSQMDGNWSQNVVGAFGNGGTARLENVSVQSNRSEGEVGAIRNSGSLEIIGSQINGNSNGNGLGTVYQGELGTLIIEDTSINGNSSARNGGAVAGYYDGEILLRRVEMKDNRAYNGGAIFTGTNLTLEDCTITGNQAVHYGGGIGLFGGQATILRSLIQDNTTGAKGGGVYQSGGSLSIHDSEISKNDSGTAGGGLYLAGQAEILKNTVVENSSEYGGGLYSQGEVQVHDSDFHRNNAEKDGGGIYSTGQMEVTNSQIHENWAQTFNAGGMGGGGIVNTGSLDLFNSAIDGNSANARGGGISNSGSLNLADSSLIANISQDFGGGICNEGAMTVTNGTFSRNSGKFGGGLGITSGSTNLLNVTIVDNIVVMEEGTAAGGGGINLWNGELTIQNSVIAGNHYDSGESGPFQDCILFTGYATINNLGNNLIGIADGCEWPSASGDQAGTLTNPLNPGLLPLQNAGITRFYEPMPGSPLLDTANAAACPPADQRSIHRPQGPGCDIGAVEAELPGLVIDIKPKSPINRINITSPGHVAVAVLTTTEFNAPLLLQPATLTFGRTGSEASLYYRGDKLICMVGDANVDGLPDLVCEFVISRTGLQCGDQSAILRAYNHDQNLLEGRDQVLLSPCP